MLVDGVQLCAAKVLDLPDLEARLSFAKVRAGRPAQPAPGGLATRLGSEGGSGFELALNSAAGEGSVRSAALGAWTPPAWNSPPRLRLLGAQEVHTLFQLHHPNVVLFSGYCVNNGQGVLLMEYCEGRDLYTALPMISRATGQRAFCWQQRGKRVLLDVARGLHYLHRRHLTHFDIKSRNVLLTRNLEGKLAGEEGAAVDPTASVGVRRAGRLAG